MLLSFLVVDRVDGHHGLHLLIAPPWRDRGAPVLWQDLSSGLTNINEIVNNQ